MGYLSGGGLGKVGFGSSRRSVLCQYYCCCFGPETQETVDNLHHLLLQSWVLYLIFKCLNFLIYKTEIRAPSLWWT